MQVSIAFLSLTTEATSVGPRASARCEAPVQSWWLLSLAVSPVYRDRRMRIRERLHRGTLSPSSEAEVGAVQRSATRRRRRRTIVGVLALVGVGAAVTAIVTNGEHDAGVARTPEPSQVPSTALPPLPTTIGGAVDPGVSITGPLPPNWTLTPEPLYFDVGGLPTPRSESSVATFPVPATPSPICDYPIAALEALGPTDGFVSVVDSEPGPFYVDPRPEPSAFLPPAEPVSQQEIGQADISTQPCLSRAGDFRFAATGFLENDRMVVVYVAIGLNAPPNLESDIEAIVSRVEVPPRSVGSG